MTFDHKSFLRGLFKAGVDAAHPRHCLPPYLAACERNHQGRTVVIGAGKAAAAMAEVFEHHWPNPVEGLVVTRYGHGASCWHIEVIEAAHPVPDKAGHAVAQRILDLVIPLKEGDRVICLLSGGGSSLLTMPAPGISLEEKRSVNRALLRSGASIEEMNCVRKHLSAIKGGRLAAACYPAEVLAFAISDVPGDRPSVIASGPTVADTTTCDDARAILARYNINAPGSVIAWLTSTEAETIKSGDQRLARANFTLIATPQDSLQTAAHAEQHGFSPIILGDSIEGESREVAKVHAAVARQVKQYRQPLPAPCVILSGGETTVTVRGNGRGGRNVEFLLSLANSLRGDPGVYAMAADSDGIDGSEDNAGAILGPDTWSRAALKNMSLDAHLADNDGYGFFEVLGDLVFTGPTRTNVNDFRAIVILDDENAI